MSVFRDNKSGCGLYSTVAYSPENTVQSDLAYPVLFYPDPSPIRKKIVGCLFTAYGMHTRSMCVRLSGSLAYPDTFVENGCVQLSEVWLYKYKHIAGSASQQP